MGCECCGLPPYAPRPRGRGGGRLGPVFTRRALIGRGASGRSPRALGGDWDAPGGRFWTRGHLASWSVARASPVWLTAFPLPCPLQVLASFDGVYHSAVVIEARRLDTPSEGGAEYYVHYANQNTRLDEWVPAGRVRAAGAAAPSDDQQVRCVLGWFCRYAAACGLAQAAGAAECC